METPEERDVRRALGLEPERDEAEYARKLAAVELTPEDVLIAGRMGIDLDLLREQTLLDEMGG